MRAWAGPSWQHLSLWAGEEEDLPLFILVNMTREMEGFIIQRKQASEKQEALQSGLSSGGGMGWEAGGRSIG